jgi:hypothetical protein
LFATLSLFHYFSSRKDQAFENSRHPFCPPNPNEGFITTRIPVSPLPRTTRTEHSGSSRQSCPRVEGSTSAKIDSTAKTDSTAPQAIDK